MKYRLLQISFYIFALVNFSNAQQICLPLNQQMQIRANAVLNKQASIHTGFKPIMFSAIKKAGFDSTNIFYFASDEHIPEKLRNSLFWRKLRNEGLFRLNKKNFYFEINPLFDFTFDNKTKTKTAGLPLAINTRGLEIKGNIGKKLSFYSDFYENQAFLPEYLSNFVQSRVIVPGQGIPKPVKTVGFDYALSSGYISWEAAKFINIQAGHGKMFVGEGYRSLFLSDNALSYPFARINIQFNKFQYTFCFSEFYNYKAFWPWHWLYRKRKAATFNYLSYKPFNWLELGWFEGSVWKSLDESDNYKLNWNYFVPLPLANLSASGYNSEKNNFISGINLKISPFENIQMYGQIVLDNPDFSAGRNSFLNRYGYQIGGKIFDAFARKINKLSLYLQGEYNYVRPFTYSHTNPNLSYSNMNQPVAHPLEAGFKEAIGIFHLNYSNFFVEGKIMLVQTSASDSTANYGTNILISDNKSLKESTLNVGQFSKIDLKHFSLRAGLIINPITNFQIFAGIDLREYKAQSTSSLNYVTFGIRTNLRNYYYDIK